jgi:MFS family permease
MTMLTYLKMPFSFRAGWNQLSATHPSVWKTFLLLSLPFALIPPLMLVLAGGQHGAAYLVDATPARWQAVAFIFLIAELLTVPLMGWVIGRIAASRGLVVRFEDAFRLAAICALPMWLSSLVLLIPQMWVVIAGIVGGLLVAADMLYHGSASILNISDRTQAQSLSYEVFSAGCLAWVFLCALVIVPLIG